MVKRDLRAVFGGGRAVASGKSQVAVALEPPALHEFEPDHLVARAGVAAGETVPWYRRRCGGRGGARPPHLSLPDHAARASQEVDGPVRTDGPVDV